MPFLPVKSSNYEKNKQRMNKIPEQFSKQPFWFNAINKTWELAYPLGTRIKLDRDDLIRRARRLTQLQDLGKDFSPEPLDRLLRSIEEEADLHPVGRFITRERFTSLLTIRLRAEEYFRRYPEILEQDLYPASIIVGLQRTGTTKLLRLLAADPEHRVIPSWEVINPVPMTNAYDQLSELKEKDIKKRISVANTSASALKVMSPDFFAIHPIEVMEPEEDILLLDVSFMSTTPEAMMHVPSYASWLENTDQSPAYSYYVKLLKFLQWSRPAKRWVLKTPHHLEFCDLIKKQFNEVHFIWPHRTIYESVPSFLSMVTYNHMVFSNSTDIGRIARHWVRKTGYMLDKALTFRAAGNNDEKFIDIKYSDLIKDSIHEIEKVYRLNGGIDAALEERFRNHEAEHPHRKYGTHYYSLADFGLNEANIDQYTQHYQDFIKTLNGRS